MAQLKDGVSYTERRAGTQAAACSGGTAEKANNDSSKPASFIAGLADYSITVFGDNVQPIGKRSLTVASRMGAVVGARASSETRRGTQECVRHKGGHDGIIAVGLPE